MNIKEALAWAKTELGATSEPESSALVLLGDVLRISRTEILANPQKGVSLLEKNKFKKYISRRKKNESVWHIIGHVTFWGMEFKVTNDVLVPRPETELLVEQVIQRIKKLKIDRLNSNFKFQIKNSRINILDLGTGSGAIAIALAKELSLRGVKGDEAISSCVIPAKAGIQKKDRFRVKPGMTEFEIVATDISTKALKVARCNAKKNGVSDRIKFIQADLFPPTSNLSPKTFDLITANLPYIPSEDMEDLAVDVHHYEPKLALDGGPGGLVIYEKMLSEAQKYLNQNGVIFCEIGINQGELFKKIAKKYFPKSKVTILGDLAGIDRIAIIELTQK